MDSKLVSSTAPTTQQEKGNSPTESPEEKPLSLVEEAAKIRDEIRAENDRRERLLKEEERIQANKILGGTTGSPAQEKKPELSPQEYSKALLEGKFNK